MISMIPIMISVMLCSYKAVPAPVPVLFVESFAVLKLKDVQTLEMYCAIEPF